jgi:hypothetical protein
LHRYALAVRASVSHREKCAIVLGAAVGGCVQVEMQLTHGLKPPGVNP